MIRARVLKQVAVTTFREFWRTPEALFWTYGFPIMMAVVLGLAFSSSTPRPLPVVVVQSDSAPLLLLKLSANERLEVEILPREAAEQGFRRGRFLLLISGSAAEPEIKLDRGRPDSELARLHAVNSLIGGVGSGEVPDPGLRTVFETTPGSRYIDWLIPGLLALNLLGSGLWGVGFNLVQMRVKNLMRRLMVTPMRKAEFLLAFLLSRLVLVVPEAALLLLFGALAFGVPISGSLLLMLLLVLLGSASFIGLGMLLASRVQTIEGVSGLMNLAILPMWLLGGSLFSNERFPDFMQPLVQAMPVTHLNTALRAVMLEGQGIQAVAVPILILLGFGLVCFTLAIKLFRWT